MSSLPLQPGILAPVPKLARYLSLRLASDADQPALRACLGRLATMCDGLGSVVGIGGSTLTRMGAHLEGMHEPPSFSGALEPIAVDPRALWLWLRGEDRGELFHRGNALSDALALAFRLETVTDGFRYDSGRDLSGYEDGTETPTGHDADVAALVSSGGPGFEGASFVAVQHWQHDLRALARFSSIEQDHIVGRRRADNEELKDAPASAHVKRTAQESFSPTAFMLRRSMPWLE